MLIFTPLHRVFTDPRYSVYTLPFIFLSLGILINHYANKIRKIVFLILVPVLLTSYGWYQNSLWEDWKTAVKLIPENGYKSILLFHPCHLGFSFDYYYKGSLPRYCLYENPEGMYLKIWNWESGQKLYLFTKPWLIPN